MEDELEIKKEIKEIQVNILKPVNQNSKATQEEFESILRMVAPGTSLRTALDGALKTERGALIAIENEDVPRIIDGGFRINAIFTPQRLIELSKMDGAIILSKDIKRINYANVLLTPDSKLKSVETGTRHKAAERTAKQSGTLVIAISERKHEITLYYKNMRYPLVSTDELLRKANENIQILEKQRDLFDTHVEKLTRMELRNHNSLNQAVSAIQKGKVVQKIATDLRKVIIELGKEGTLLKTRLREIVGNVEEETDLILKDYSNLNQKKSKMFLDMLTYEELLEKDNILSALAYEKTVKSDSIKGWRVLSKTSLSEQDVALLIKEAGSLGKAIHSGKEFYYSILGEGKAPLFLDELNRIKLNI